jgi:hypothetical protein
VIAALVHSVVALLLGLWLNLSPHSWRRLPRPTGEPVVHAAGPDPHRILMVGSGAVVGYGVLTYELSMSGELARIVAGMLGRGIDVDLVVDPDLGISKVPAALEATRLERYDLVLLSIGSIDAITLLPVSRWRREMRGLLNLLAERGAATTVVLVQGIPPLTALVPLPRPLKGLIDRRWRAFNAASKAIAAQRATVTFLPFEPPPVNLLENASRQVHIDWATLLAPAVVEALGGPATA